MDTFYYCQSCDAKITMDQLALLNQGKCPTCGEIEGFSSSPKSDTDPFETARIVNDVDFLEMSLSNEEK